MAPATGAAAVRSPAAPSPSYLGELHIPIHGTDEVADVTGAGDTVIATFTLALAAGATPAEASQLANYAGSVVVMKHATASSSSAELLAAVREGQGR